jgi:glycosyltransferase involved in cell wall biosynthesis
MKVMHVIGALVAGGAERFVSSLVCDLQRANVSTRLFLLSAREDAATKSLARLVESAGVKIVSGGAEKVSVGAVLRFISDVNTYQPDVVHLHTPNTELLFAIAAPFLRHSTTLIRTVHSVNLPRKLVMKAAFRRNRVALTIACGRQVATVLQGYASGEIVVIPNGVDFSWDLNTADERRLAASSLFGTEIGAFHFLHVGRMGGGDLPTGPKAHDTLLVAWHKSGLGRENCQLHLVGDGPYREQLERLAAGDESIKFHGVVGAPEKWLMAADCFVMPSRYEGLPIAAIEALGSGLPAILSDIQPLREIGTTNCVYVPVDDSSALAVELVKVSRSRLVPERNQVLAYRQRFGMRAVTDAYLNAYKRILANRSFKPNEK